MSPEIIKLLTLALSLAGPASADTPKELLVKQGDKLLAIGDSITAGGWGPEGFTTLADGVLKAQYPDLRLAPIVLKGVGGQKAEDYLPRFQKDVIDQKPAVVFISVGINDVWHRIQRPHDEQVLARFRQNVTRMVADAQQAGIRVILLSPTIIEEDPDSVGNRRLKLYVQAEKEIAAEKKCGFVDLHNLFLAALAKRPRDVAGKHWLTSDAVHMARTGQALMAVGVLRGLGVPDAKIAPQPR